MYLQQDMLLGVTMDLWQYLEHIFFLLALYNAKSVASFCNCICSSLMPSSALIIFMHIFIFFACRGLTQCHILMIFANMGIPVAGSIVRSMPAEVYLYPDVSFVWTVPNPAEGNCHLTSYCLGNSWIDYIGKTNLKVKVTISFYQLSYFLTWVIYQCALYSLLILSIYT